MSEYITTYTGQHFEPTNPDPELIRIEDIAHALSMICRGNGHVKTFWSVGQHCICCAREAAARGLSNRMVLACLLHDASECYMSDVPTPFKNELPEYQEQEEHLLTFLQQDTVYQKYYDDILILLKTGLRISELCGLTARDLDFENHTINIDHQLLRNQEGYYIETPKTKCGIRKVPMSEEAGKALQRVLKRKTGKSIQIDGYRNFLFLNQKGMPMVACNYTSALKNIVRKYNKYHEEPLPKITPHILRHTFCTRLAQKNMNPKNLQYIMGHSSIMITLNLYAHASQTGANMEMRSLIA